MEYTLYAGILCATASCYIYRKSILKLATPYILSQIGIAMTDNKSNSKLENNMLHVEYSIENSKYNLTLPYNRRKRIPMTNLKVVAYYANGTELNLTQQPGIPYLITAEIIGAENIIVRNCINNKTIKYTKDEFIGYAEEAL